VSKHVIGGKVRGLRKLKGSSAGPITKTTSDLGARTRRNGFKAGASTLPAAREPRRTWRDVASAEPLADDPRQFVQDALRYARRTAEDPSAASMHARMACERFIRDHDEAQRPDSQWSFDDLAALKAMVFTSQMPNIKGPEAGKPIRLMDWQKLVYANVFGFKERATGGRRFRQGVVYVPKGNGKTTISAPLAMYMTFGEGEGGAEGYAAAVTRDQARILFETAQNMVRRSDDMRKRWGVGVLTNSIFQERTASRLVPISSDAKALDGLNVAVAVCDEIGSHRTPEVYAALSTAMGKRTQPFLLSISTATQNNAGIGRQLWDYSLRVLQGVQTDERLFSIIFSIDDTDDPWEEPTWIKANPAWGRLRSAGRDPRDHAAGQEQPVARGFRQDAPSERVDRSRRATVLDPSVDALRRPGSEARRPRRSRVPSRARPRLEDRPRRARRRLPGDAGRGCSLHRRLSLLLERGSRDGARNASYPGWANANELIITPGNETDFATIEDDVVEWFRRFRVLSMAYDPWRTTQLAQRLQSSSVPVVEFRATRNPFPLRPANSRPRSAPDASATTATDPSRGASATSSVTPTPATTSIRARRDRRTRSTEPSR
jgi:Phage terminase-like protein, large subunit